MNLELIQNFGISLFIFTWTISKIFKNKRAISHNKEINLLKTYKGTVKSLIIQTIVCFVVWLLLQQNSIVNILKLNMFKINILTYIFLFLMLVLIVVFFFIGVDFGLPNNYDRNTYNVFIPSTIEEKNWFYIMNTVAPILEEIIYRGFLVTSLVFIFHSNIVAIIISSFIFGVAHSHYGKNGMISMFVGSFILGIYFIYTNSIIINILLHFIYNGILLYGMKSVTDKNVIEQ